MVDEEVMKSLYVLNKHAKQYAELASENYHIGKKTTAKANSNKKKALYDVKSTVLYKIQGEAERIMEHTIDGEKYYCLYFDGYSFHVPVDDISINQPVDGSDEIYIDNSSEKEINRSLKDSLLCIQNELGLNANNRLPEKKIDYGHNRYFIGWKYLD